MTHFELVQYYHRVAATLKLGTRLRKFDFRISLTYEYFLFEWTMLERSENLTLAAHDLLAVLWYVKEVY